MGMGLVTVEAWVFDLVLLLVALDTIAIVGVFFLLDTIFKDREVLSRQVEALRKPAEDFTRFVIPEGSRRR